MNMNRLEKIKMVAEIVQNHFEPGRQDRSLEWVCNNIVNKQFPMSLRTFRRYIKIAEERLGYSFAERSNDKRYLVDIYNKMQPQTLKTVKTVCKEAQRSKVNRKTELCTEIQERLGLEISNQQLGLYLLVGQHCMGYNIAY